MYTFYAHYLIQVKMSKTTDKVIQLAEEQMLVEKLLTPKKIKLKTVNIKGKPYVEVNERVKYFLATKKRYTLETEIIDFTSEYCVMKAMVKNEVGVIVSTGHAHEIFGSTFINKTSYVENCETSAIGRALGFIGIGIDTSIASADEVKQAIKQQTKKKSTITEGRFKDALEAIAKGEYSVERLKSEFELTNEQLKSI